MIKKKKKRTQISKSGHLGKFKIVLTYWEAGIGQDARSV